MKETYMVNLPKKIVFGDPLYFEEFKGEKLDSLVVDFSPPRHFEAAVVLQEAPFDEMPDITDRTMTIFLAPAKTMGVYLNDMVFESQDETFKENWAAPTHRADMSCERKMFQSTNLTQLEKKCSIFTCPLTMGPSTASSGSAYRDRRCRSPSEACTQVWNSQWRQGHGCRPAALRRYPAMRRWPDPW